MELPESWWNFDEYIKGFCLGDNDRRVRAGVACEALDDSNGAIKTRAKVLT